MGDDIDAVLAAGRALGTSSGSCSTCSNGSDSAPEFGYRATVKGVVSDLGDGSEGGTGTPILTDIQMLDENVGCGGNPTIPPMCRSGEMIDTPTTTEEMIDTTAMTEEVIETPATAKNPTPDLVGELLVGP